MVAKIEEECREPEVVWFTAVGRTSLKWWRRVIRSPVVLSEVALELASLCWRGQRKLQAKVRARANQLKERQDRSERALDADLHSQPKLANARKRNAGIDPHRYDKRLSESASSFC